MSSRTRVLIPVVPVVAEIGIESERLTIFRGVIPAMTELSTLYQTDYSAWAQRNAELLRSRALCRTGS